MNPIIKETIALTIQFACEGFKIKIQNTKENTNVKAIWR